jgi:mannose-6-phosphate isomerase-like protein (cupin superfamily)
MSDRQTGFFKIEDLHGQRAKLANAYREFLRVPSMSAGVYVLTPGSTDLQSPHQQDEMYYVLGGKARMRAGSEDHSLQSGTVIFVAAEVEHRFYDIDEELILLVFFAPPETEGA